MENIISQLINAGGIPGGIAVIIFITFNKKLISIISATDFDKIFLSKEKKFILRAWNWIKIILFTLMLQLFCFGLFSTNKFVISKTLETILNFLFALPLFVACGLYTFKESVIAIKLKKKLNTGFIGDIVMVVYYLGFIFVSDFSIYKYFNSNKTTNIYFTVVAGMLLCSILIPKSVVFIIKSWLNRQKVCYVISYNDTDWYLIKPLGDNEYMLGDNESEEKCEKFRVIKCDVLKEKEISKKTTSLPL